MGISHELSEEDVKFRYINEAITSKGWTKDSIFMEQQLPMVKSACMAILCIVKNQSSLTMCFM